MLSFVYTFLYIQKNDGAGISTNDNFIPYTIPYPSHQSNVVRGEAKITIDIKFLHHLTNLQISAIRAHLLGEITIRCVYYTDEDIYVKLLSVVFIVLRYLFVGDFDANSTICGSKCTNRKAKIIEDMLDDFKLMLLNNTAPHAQ